MNRRQESNRHSSSSRRSRRGSFAVLALVALGIAMAIAAAMLRGTLHASRAAKQRWVSIQAECLMDAAEIRWGLLETPPEDAAEADFPGIRRWRPDSTIWDSENLGPVELTLESPKGSQRRITLRWESAHGTIQRSRQVFEPE
ncbi:MAG: hypothetical protein AAF958_00190 [Planctomycetota bacterium]